MNDCKPNPSQMRLGQLTAFLARLQAVTTDRHMERIGLYRGQAVLLMFLSERDGLTHSELAEKLEISPAAATKVIKRLEALKYLSRRPDPADERISRVYLEDGGRAVIQQIRRAFNQVEDAMLRGFSAAEKETLAGLLARMYTNLSEQAGDPETP